MVYAIKLGRSPQGHKIKLTRAFKNCDVDALLEDLQSASWETSSRDIDDKWNHWKSVLLNILDRHAPLVRCRVRSESLPWINADIRKLMRKRNQIRSRASRIGSDELWNSYRNVRNKVTVALKQAKHAFFVSLTNKPSRSARRTWKQLNRLLGRGKRATPSIADHDIAHEGDAAGTFSDYFSRLSGTSQKRCNPLPFQVNLHPSLWNLSLERRSPKH